MRRPHLGAITHPGARNRATGLPLQNLPTPGVENNRPATVGADRERKARASR